MGATFVATGLRDALFGWIYYVQNTMHDLNLGFYSNNQVIDFNTVITDLTIIGSWDEGDFQIMTGINFPPVAGPGDHELITGDSLNWTNNTGSTLSLYGWCIVGSPIGGPTALVAAETFGAPLLVLDGTVLQWTPTLQDISEF